MPMSEAHVKSRQVSTFHLVGRTALIGIAYLVRVAGLTAQGLWRDEVDQWRFAFQSWPELLGNFTRSGWNGPLYSPLLRTWIALTGESVYGMRYLSLLCGVLAVPLFYVLARRLRGARVAGLSALLLALSPYMVWYGQEIKMYAWLPLLVLLALYALERACHQPNWGWWAVVLLGTTLAVYSHILAALLIPVLVLWFWLHPRRHRRAWIGGLVVISGLTLPYLPLLRWQAALALMPRETGFAAHTLGQMMAVLLRSWSSGIFQGAWARPASLRVMAGLFGLLTLAGFALLVFTGAARAALRCAAWLGLPLLAIWLVSLRGPIFTDRYLIWAAPAFYMLIGVALGQVWLWLGQWGLLAMLPLVVVAGHGLYAQAAHPIKPQFDLAVEVVRTHHSPSDILLFQIPYNRHVFDFYAGGALGPWAEAPYSNWRRPDGTYKVDAAYVTRELRPLVSGYDRVWLVYSEFSLWDERELVRQWLDEHYHHRQTWPFAGVTLLLYERPPQAGR